MTDLATYVGAIEETFGGLLAAVSDLTPAQWDLPTDLPGWSVKDNVSHVVGVELLMLGEPYPEHTLPPGLDHVKNEAGQWTEVPVDVRRSLPGAAVYAELQDVVERRVKALRAMDESALEGEAAGFFGKPIKVRHLLGIRVFDVWTHEQDVRRALGLPRSLSGAAAELSLRRCLLALSGRSPEGRVVVIETTGALPTVSTLTLGSSYVPGAAESWDVRITADFETFMLLATGRAFLPSESVSVVGDADVAGEFLRHIAVPP